MEDRLAVLEEAGGTVRHQPFALGGADRLAQVGLAGFTEFALAALRGVERDHVIADRHAGDAFTDRFHHAAALVAEDRREHAFRIFAGQGVGVGVTNAGGDDPHQHFAFLRWHQLDFFDLQRLVRAPGNGGAGFDHLHHSLLSGFLFKSGDIDNV